MKSLIRALVFAGVLAGFACSSAAVELPWKTFSEFGAAAIGGGPAMCPDGPVFTATAEGKDGSEFHLITNEAGRLVVLYWKPGAGPGSKVDEVGFGTIDPKSDKFPPLTWLSLDQVLKQFPEGPCQILFQPSA